MTLIIPLRNYGASPDFEDLHRHQLSKEVVTGRREDGGSTATSAASQIERSGNPALSCLFYRCYLWSMTTAEDIEKAVEQLPPGELARFRAWFEAFDAREFDAAIERDVQAGKLDALADEALAAHRAGRSREL